ncbi:MAG: hypothetical protein COC17_07055 [Hyphomicrobiales bacterium]|nr:sugar nucleotide-binding protein [Hyphomicrobiales bacterium]PCH49831.1 MAG: hypothetical protein COC17_07055 [Hyphomicrobiales bacterium]
MKILIIGSKGMLGQACVKHFSKSHKVSVFNDRYSLETRECFTKSLSEFDIDLTIHCVGKIPQVNSNEVDLFQINSAMTMDLVNVMDANNIPFIYPSTDCVFNGHGPNNYYSKDHFQDCNNSYGVSKLIGEKIVLGSNNGYVVRVSIIGPDIRPSARGLWNWVNNWPIGCMIDGYINHTWNGITTLQWCKEIEKLFILGNPDRRLYQLGTKKNISKYHLIKLIATKLGKENIINEVSTAQNVNRSLFADYDVQEIEKQIDEIMVNKDLV